ncbi:MAG: hypothetical protein ABFD50_11450 [Smithella sp.]
MALYRKKPVVIEAIKVDYLKNGLQEVEKFLGFEPKIKEFEREVFLVIETLEGDMKLSPNDWIIKGVNGEFYPCKPDIFEKTYEPA